MRYWIVVIFLSLSIFSCTEKEKVSYESSFFDIEQFVDSLLTENSKSEIVREIVINGEKETKTLEENDVTEIFEFLKQFNINRPKWYDKYKVTKTQNETMYQAIEKDFETKEVKVIENNNGITEVQIFYKSKTLISSAEKMIIWKPRTRLDYKNTSKSLWSDSQFMDISWTYKL